MEYTYLKPQELRNSWEYIKKGLSTILKKSPEQWIPEDIYADCVNGHSHVVLFSEKDKALGFCVLQKRNTDLHIWCAYSEVSGYLQQAFEKIKTIAKESQLDKITFETWRNGWERKAKHLGFKPRTYYMEI
jgi:hypothetical protein